MILQHQGQVSSALFSPCGRYLFTTNNDENGHLWDICSENGDKLYTISHGPSIYAAVFSPCGKYIFTSGPNATTKIWDSASGTLLNTFSDNGTITSATYNRLNQCFLTATTNNKANILDGTSRDLIHTFIEHTAKIHTAKFSPCGQFIVTASQDNTAKLWNFNFSMNNKPLKLNQLVFILFAQVHKTRTQQPLVLNYQELQQCFDSLEPAMQKWLISSKFVADHQQASL